MYFYLHSYFNPRASDAAPLVSQIKHIISIRLIHFGAGLSFGIAAAQCER